LNESLKHYGFKKITNPVLDTVELTRILYPQAPSYKLNQLAVYLNLNHKQPHRALSDAYITAEILLKLMEKMSDLLYRTVTYLLKLEKYLHSDLYTMLYVYQQNCALSSTIDQSFDYFHGLVFITVKPNEEQLETSIESFGDLL